MMFVALKELLCRYRGAAMRAKRGSPSPTSEAKAAGASLGETCTTNHIRKLRGVTFGGDESSAATEWSSLPFSLLSGTGKPQCNIADVEMRRCESGRVTQYRIPYGFTNERRGAAARVPVVIQEVMETALGDGAS